MRPSGGEQSRSSGSSPGARLPPGGAWGTQARSSPAAKGAPRTRSRRWSRPAFASRPLPRASAKHWSICCTVSKGVRSVARQDVNQALLQTSFLYGANSAYIEALQAEYEKAPLSVEPGWREFFDALGDDPASVVKTARGASWRQPNWPATPKGDLINALDGDWPATEKAITDKLLAKAAEAGPKAAPSEDEIRRATRDSVRALMMIRAYRMRGHLYANLDPLGLEPQRDHEELHPSTYGFEDFDYDRKIFLEHVLRVEYGAVPRMLAILRRTYCGPIGFEFVHISDPAEKAWIQERVEGPDKEIQFTREGKRAILGKLAEAEGFENFFDVKYPGAKRFGLDGAEAMIPALEQIIKRGGQLGLRDIALGIAPRGRLNVLSQAMGQPHRG